MYIFLYNFVGIFFCIILLHFSENIVLYIFSCIIYLFLCTVRFCLAVNTHTLQYNALEHGIYIKGTFSATQRLKHDKSV